jgi:hypothetical protein
VKAGGAARGVPQADARMSRFGRMVLPAQGSDYLLTGVRPLVSIGPFQAVKGPRPYRSGGGPATRS